jgi:hypothetical protein
MYTAQFSEFSYGYALTDNILHSGLPCTAHAPVFPSLYAEGSAGGGYDVKIPTHPVPLFLQFKIPQVMRRASAQMPFGFVPPYMRMHLRTKRPNQHRLLRNLEAAGNTVYYATPDFWRTTNLDDYFWNQTVQFESWYVSPSAIGALSSKSHHVAYERGNATAWICSKPRKLEGRYDAEHFGAAINAAVKAARPQDAPQFFRSLAAQIRELTVQEFGQTSESDAGRHPSEIRVRERTRKPQAQGTVPLETRRAGREAAYLAQVRLSCTLIITGRD